jgi:hypothetical protein
MKLQTTQLAASVKKKDRWMDESVKRNEDETSI